MKNENDDLALLHPRDRRSRFGYNRPFKKVVFQLETPAELLAKRADEGAYLFTYFGWALSVVIVCGNGGGYSSGVNINGNPTAGSVEKSKFVPINLETIEMLTEDLEIDLFPKDARITVRYELLNPGGKKPLGGLSLRHVGQRNERAPARGKIYRFRAEAGRAKLSLRVKAGNAPKAEGVKKSCRSRYHGGSVPSRVRTWSAASFGGDLSLGVRPVYRNDLG